MQRTFAILPSKARQTSAPADVFGKPTRLAELILRLEPPVNVAGQKLVLGFGAGAAAASREHPDAMMSNALTAQVLHGRLRGEP
jgi:hypothetical protein